MNRILHISKYYWPFRGGTEQIAQDCATALKGRCRQKVICFNHEKEDANDIVEGIEVIRCGCFAKISSQSLSASYGRILTETLLDFCPDIVIFHYPNPFAANYLIRFLSKDVKLVLYWHLDITKQKLLRFFFINQNQRLADRANLVISTSHAYLEGSPYLKQILEKCVVIPNCINVGRFQDDEEICKRAEMIHKENEGKIICFAAGRHTEYKGFRFLIKACRRLDERFRIYIAGKGELTEALRKEAEADDKIKFLGLVSELDLMAYLKAMDIFCFPSITKNEAFGLALAEAMYCGKPAVTFTIPGSGVNYVCLNGENGLEVPNRDVKAYAEAMKRLADDESLRLNLGRKGKERVENFFLSSLYQKNIVNELEKL